MLLRELFEQSSKVAVLAFGRMNPPTIGHAKLVDKIKSIPGDHFLFLSHSQDRKKDPLDFNTKLKFANAFFPGIEIGREGVNTPVVALEYIQNQGYTDVVFVAGSDRVDGFQKLFDTYNGKPDKTGKVPFQFDSITVVSAGERDPDADGAEGMSASKMRAAAAAGDIEAFAQGVPDPKLAQQMYDAVRKSMGIGQTVGEESAILKKNDSDLISAIDIEENFADGKVKGKSRPGRVKRAGASCKGSVTDLRKRAKVGGERGKMYHWCANMKSGKK
jgi:hypothetical protein